jgi:hypothetical protein
MATSFTVDAWRGKPQRNAPAWRSHQSRKVAGPVPVMFSTSSVMFTERRARKTSFRRSMSRAWSGGFLAEWRPGRIRAGHVLEVDRAAGHLGDDLDLLAGGQRLRAGQEIPLAGVAVVGEGGHGDACDVFRVHHGKHAIAGRVGDLPSPDGVAPGEGVGREGAGPQVGHTEAGSAQELLARRERGSHGVAVQRQQARAGGGEQDDSGHRRFLRGGDHRLGLPGPGSDVHQEDGLGASDRLRHACRVVEIAGGDSCCA